MAPTPRFGAQPSSAAPPQFAGTQGLASTQGSAATLGFAALPDFAARQRYANVQGSAALQGFATAQFSAAAHGVGAAHGCVMQGFAMQGPAAEQGQLAQQPSVSPTWVADPTARIRGHSPSSGLPIWPAGKRSPAELRSPSPPQLHFVAEPRNAATPQVAARQPFVPPTWTSDAWSRTPSPPRYVAAQQPLWMPTWTTGARSRSHTPTQALNHGPLIVERVQVVDRPVYIDRIVERVVERQVPVYIDRIVEKIVHRDTPVFYIERGIEQERQGYIGTRRSVPSPEQSPVYSARGMKQEHQQYIRTWQPSPASEETPDYIQRDIQYIGSRRQISASEPLEAGIPPRRLPPTYYGAGLPTGSQCSSTLGGQPVPYDIGAWSSGAWRSSRQKFGSDGASWPYDIGAWPSGAWRSSRQEARADGAPRSYDIGTWPVSDGATRPCDIGAWSSGEAMAPADANVARGEAAGAVRAPHYDIGAWPSAAWSSGERSGPPAASMQEEAKDDFPYHDPFDGAGFVSRKLEAAAY